MGVDAGDFSNSGAQGLAITNFDNEMVGLYRPLGRGLFEDVAARVGRRRRVAKLARVRLRLRGSRSGRQPGSRGRQRPHRGNRPQHPRQRRLRAAAAPVPQSGQRHVSRRRIRRRRRLLAAQGRTRAGLRRFRSRRRRRPADHDQQRPGVPLPQRSAGRQPQHPLPPRRHHVQPRRDRRRRPHLSRRLVTVAHGQERLELPFAVRIAGHLRRRQTRSRRSRRHRVAERPQRRVQEPRRPGKRTNASKARRSAAARHNR